MLSPPMGETMALVWIHEHAPMWDDHKQAVIGGAPAGAFDSALPATQGLLPGEWWRCEQDGTTAGYGWMDIVWGDGEILLAVAPDKQSAGVGSFILDRLEAEAAARGLNYIYNTIRPDHPVGAKVAEWLGKRRFRAGHDDDRLVRQVRLEHLLP